MPGRGNRFSRRARAFTFPEVVALVGVMALMAGLAAQLLLSAHAFTSRVEAQQDQLQAAMRLRLELARWTQNVLPDPWANPERTFVQNGSAVSVYQDPSDPKSNVWTLDVKDRKLIAVVGDERAVWGPFDALSVDWWKNGGRVVGVAVTWSDHGEPRRWLFAWGSRPL